MSAQSRRLTPFRRSKKGSRAKRGYTLIEVMMAMSVLAVGATGIVAVQKTAVWGNVASRHLVTANMVAVTWAERLRQDALRWNTDAADRNADTIWLDDANVGVGWFRPADPVDTDMGIADADVLGRDIQAGDAGETAYCTNVRLQPLITDEIIRAEIRVHWSKTMQPIDCTVIPTDDPVEMDTFGFIYLTTSVNRNPLQ